MNKVKNGPVTRQRKQAQRPRGESWNWRGRTQPSALTASILKAAVLHSSVPDPVFPSYIICQATLFLFCCCLETPCPGFLRLCSCIFIMYLFQTQVSDLFTLVDSGSQSRMVSGVVVSSLPGTCGKGKRGQAGAVLTLESWPGTLHGPCHSSTEQKKISPNTNPMQGYSETMIK